MERMPWWRRFRVNPLFFVAIVIYWIAGGGRTALIGFLAVTLHELTHAVVANLYGLEVSRVEIWPFGGLAEIQGLDAQDPYVEAMVAVSGPLLNFFWAAVAWAFLPVLSLDAKAVTFFITANLSIGALNLLPVAPLDGGRLARAFLARSVGYQVADQRVQEGGLWLARSLFAVTLGLLALGHIHVGLGTFAGFLYWGVWRSGHKGTYLAVRDLAERLAGFQRRPVWPVDDFAASSRVPINKIIGIMRPLKYHRVVVLDDSMKRLGVIYEETLLLALQEKGPGCPLGDLLVDRD